MRPWLGLVGLNWYGPLTWISASVWECSQGSANTWRNRLHSLSEMRRRKGYGLLFEDLGESINSAFPVDGSAPLKGRQAELVDCHSPRSEPRRICSFTWHPIHQRFHLIPRKSPAEAARPKGGPEREVWNLRFQRFFRPLLGVQKRTAGRGAAQAPHPKDRTIYPPPLSAARNM